MTDTVVVLGLQPGDDYAVQADAVNSIPADLKTLPGHYVIYVRNDQIWSAFTIPDFDGDSAHKLIIQAYPGDEVVGTGAGTTFSGDVPAGACVNVTSSYTEIRGIGCINTSATGGSGLNVSDDLDGVEIYKCFIQGYRGYHAGDGSNDRAAFINTLFYSPTYRGYESGSIGATFRSAFSGCTFLSAVEWGCVIGASPHASAQLQLDNCVGYGVTGGFSGGAAGLAIRYQGLASSDASASSFCEGNITDIAFDNITTSDFADYAGGDFNILQSSALVDAGHLGRTIGAQLGPDTYVMVGTATDDYTSLAAAVSAIPNDISGATGNHIIDVRGNIVSGGLGYLPAVTTSSNKRVIIRALSGGSVLADGTGGPSIVTASSNGFYRGTNLDHFEIDGFYLEQSHSTQNGFIIYSKGNHHRIKNCVVSILGSGHGVSNSNGSGKHTDVENCIIKTSGGQAFDAGNAVDGTFRRFKNVTGVGTTGNRCFDVAHSGYNLRLMEFINNLAIPGAGGTGFGSSILPALSDYNASTDATANLVSNTTQFENRVAANDVDENYNLLASSTLVGAGYNGENIGAVLGGLSGSVVSASVAPSAVSQGQSLNQVTLSQHSILVCDPISQGQLLPVSLLSSNAALSCDPLIHSQSINAGVLAEHGVLLVHSVSHLQALLSDGLAARSVVSSNRLDQGQSLNSVVMSQAHVLAMGGLSQGQTLEAVNLVVAGVLGVDPINQPLLLSSVPLVSEGVLLPDSLVHSHGLSDSAVASRYALLVDALTHLQELGRPALSVQQLLSVDELNHLQSVSDAQLIPHGVLAVGGISHQQLLVLAQGAPVIGWIEGQIVIVTALDGGVSVTPAMGGGIAVH